MGRTEKTAVRLTAILLIVFSIAGILILWTKQGTGVMARRKERLTDGLAEGDRSKDCGCRKTSFTPPGSAGAAQCRFHKYSQSESVHGVHDHNP